MRAAPSCRPTSARLAELRQAFRSHEDYEGDRRMYRGARGKPTSDDVLDGDIISTAELIRTGWTEIEVVAEDPLANETVSFDGAR